MENKVRRYNTAIAVREHQILKLKGPLSLMKKFLKVVKSKSSDTERLQKLQNGEHFFIKSKNKLKVLEKKKNDILEEHDALREEKRVLEDQIKKFKRKTREVEEMIQSAICLRSMKVSLYTSNLSNNQKISLKTKINSMQSQLNSHTLQVEEVNPRLKLRRSKNKKTIS
ncbi:unnamed protein product [Moneuplotes crassus]|uniref:Uncharacterized protein n=1 Tax=Euplotes crassus TaxID=5936 RepID=A0AAD1XKB7_EUPCR|nr:unnamed protein product [Moneuplotes crassus]